MWEPTVIDVRGPGYGFVQDAQEKARAVWAIDYPEPGLNVTAGNWGYLSPSDLVKARNFMLEQIAKKPELAG